MLTLRRIAAMAAAGALVAAGGTTIAGAAVPLPDDDPFYEAPKGLADAKRGAILRSRPVDVSALGLPLPFRSWQILYRTNDTHRKPVATVATVLLPLGAAPGPRPLLSYQPAEDALTTRCAPSYKMRRGTLAEELAMLLPLLRGWAVVVPDYEGPDSQWIASRMAAHGVLDGIRAAERFKPLGLPGRRTPVGMWGYSGGGHATGWAAALQPKYAPRLNLKGAAYGGAPVDIEASAKFVEGGPFAAIPFAAAVGLSRAYPEMGVESLLNARGKAMFEDLGDKCIDEFIASYPFARFSEFTTVPDPFSVPSVKRVLDQNRMSRKAPGAPVYVYHSILDELNPIEATDTFVARYCNKGVAIRYKRIILGEHIVPVAAEAPGAVQYLADRFAGQPAPTTC